MTSSPAPDLEELERLEQKTRRHWDFDYNAPNDILAGDGSGKLMARAWEQAEFIIKLRNAAPALLQELRAAREAQTPLAPPAGISPVETAGHSSPDLEPRTEAGRLDSRGRRVGGRVNNGRYLRARDWREIYAGLATKWATLLERLDLAEDATPDDIIAAAKKAAR